MAEDFMKNRKIKTQTKVSWKPKWEKTEVEGKNKHLKYSGSPFNNQWSKMWTSSSIPKLVLIHLFTIKIQQILLDSTG